MADIQKSCCPECKKTQEVCADAETCPSWRNSYDICIIFGTRPYRAGFKGAGTE